MIDMSNGQNEYQQQSQPKISKQLDHLLIRIFYNLNQDQLYIKITHNSLCFSVMNSDRSFVYKKICKIVEV